MASGSHMDHRPTGTRESLFPSSFSTNRPPWPRTSVSLSYLLSDTCRDSSICAFLCSPPISLPPADENSLAIVLFPTTDRTSKSSTKNHRDDDRRRRGAPLQAVTSRPTLPSFVGKKQSTALPISLGDEIICQKIRDR